jgi:hypothetical protein
MGWRGRCPGWLEGKAASGSKKALLFEKRSKNFCLLVRAVWQRLPVIIKSFLVLFFKKELLSFFLVARRGSWDAAGRCAGQCTAAW